jgi:REP element-mobilizing transposase RayT
MGASRVDPADEFDFVGAALEPPSSSTVVQITTRRRPLRLRDYDYSNPGAYFVTICSHQRRPLFGRIHDGVMTLNPVGEIVAETWREQMEITIDVNPDEWILMPHHFHAIILIEAKEGGSRAAPTRPLPRIVNAFKTVSGEAHQPNSPRCRPAGMAKKLL